MEERESGNGQPLPGIPAALRDAMAGRPRAALTSFGSGMHLGGDRTLRKAMTLRGALFTIFRGFEWPAQRGQKKARPSRISGWMCRCASACVQSIGNGPARARAHLSTLTALVTFVCRQNNALEKFMDDATCFDIGAHRLLEWAGVR